MERTAQTYRKAKGGWFSPWPAVLLLLLATSAKAQLSDQDIQDLRRRGESEGWTFSVGRSQATYVPIERLCGTASCAEVEPSTETPPLRRTREALPERFDWRAFNGCTPIKNQGQGPYCWAFAIVGMVECNVLISDGDEVDLSEQYLVNCVYPPIFGPPRYGDMLSGCVLEEDLPYMAAKGPCNSPYPLHYAVESWGYVGTSTGIPATDSIKQAIITYGPLDVSVYVGDAFQAYSGGVFNANYNYSINHDVVLVGWSDDGGYWIMRNSWGPSWGENGYMRIAYGVSRIGYAAKYVVYPGPERPHRGSVPGPPTLSSPEMEADGLSSTPDLDWSDVPEADGYDIYLWEADTTRPDTPTYVFVRESEFGVPDALDYGVTYSWQVVPKNLQAASEGPVWSFSTAPRIEITTALLTPAIIGQEYSQQLTATGPPLPHEWSLKTTQEWDLSEVAASTGTTISSSELAYDAERRDLYRFGGGRTWPFSVSNGFYVLNLDSMECREVTDSGRPSGRICHTMVVDTTRDRLLLFGGAYWRQVDTYNYADVTLSDAYKVMAFDFGTGVWSTLSTSGYAPSKRHGCAGFYSEEQDALYIDGGKYGLSNGSYYWYDETYRLRLSSNTWERVNTGGGSPGRRIFHRFWETGEQTGIITNDEIYTFDASTAEWYQIPRIGEWPEDPGDYIAVSSTSGSLILFPSRSSRPAYEMDLPNGFCRVMNQADDTPRGYDFACSAPHLGGALLVDENRESPFLATLTPETLPPGLELSSAGTISGTATEEGTFPFTVQTSEASNPDNRDTRAFVLQAGHIPHVDQSPISQTLYTGMPLELGIQATGTAPITYQWQKDGSEIAGANGASCTIDGLQLSDAGSYTCAVSNPFGHAVSAPAVLTVLPAVERFVLSHVESPQQVAVPFPVTITAQDANGLTTTHFAGTARVVGLVAQNAELPGDPGTPNSGSSSYTRGIRFVPSSDVTVTHFRRYWGSRVSLWGASGDLLATQTTAEAGGVWS
ncbi:MAG: hypothetical protein HON70_42925, partial [Lentisphaerae bacterium]|nr:hypothetical protein [Lentisphaerota bacterium]